MAVTADIDAVHTGFDTLMRYPNLAELVEHGAEVLAITYLNRIFQAVASGADDSVPRARSNMRMGVPAGLLAILTILFFVADVPRESSQFAVDYGNQAAVLGFWFISMGYLAWASHQMVKIAVTHAPRIRRTDVKVGVTLTGVACALLYPFTAAELLKLWSRHLPVGVSASVATTSDVTKAVAVVLFAAGLGMPAVTRAARSAARLLSDYLCLQALRPMWWRVVEAVPSARFRMEDSKTRSAWRDLVPFRIHLKLSGRVIEILDAQLVLAGYAKTGDLDESYGASAMAREAAWTRAALSRRAYGEAPSNRERAFVEGRDTISQEGSYLVGVWQHMTLQAVSAEPGRFRLQTILSRLLAPRPLAALVSLAGGLLAGRGVAAGFGWGLAALTAAPLLPAVGYALAQRQLKSDLDKTFSIAARVLPLSAATLLVFVDAGVLAVAQAPRLTILTAISMGAAALTLMGLRLWTNVSGHVATAAGATAFAVLVISPWMALLLIAVLGLADARVKLGVHTLPQVAWALIVGLVASAIPLLAGGYGLGV